MAGRSPHATLIRESLSAIIRVCCEATSGELQYRVALVNVLVFGADCFQDHVKEIFIMAINMHVLASSWALSFQSWTRRVFLQGKLV